MARSIGRFTASVTAHTAGYKRGMLGAANATRHFGQSAARMGRDMGVGAARSRSFGVAMNRSGRSAQRFGAGVSQATTAMSAFRGILGVVLAGGALSLFARKVAAIEVEMNKLIGVVGLSRNHMERYQRDVMRLAEQTGRAHLELAEAFYIATSAGLRGKTAYDTVAQAAKSAAAGAGETRDIVFAAAAAVNTYGDSVLSASRAIDIVHKAIQLGTTDPQEFSQALSNVVPIGEALSVSFDEVAAAMALMTRKGFSAAESATQLGAYFNALIKGSSEGRRVLRDVNTSYEELRDITANQGVVASLNHLNRAIGGNIESLGKVVPRIRGMRAVMSLAKNEGAEFADILESIETDLAAVDEAFAKTETSTRAFQQGMNALYGEFERLLGGQEQIRRMAEWFRDDLVPGVVDVFKKLQQGLRPLIFIIRSIALAFGKLYDIVKKVNAEGGALKAAFAGLEYIFSFDMARDAFAHFGELMDMGRIRDEMEANLAEYDKLSKAAEERMSKAAEMVKNGGLEPQVASDEYNRIEIMADWFGRSAEEAEQFTEQLKEAGKAGGWMSQKIGDGLQSLILGAKSAAEAFKDLAREILAAVTRSVIVNPLADAISGGITGFFTDTALSVPKSVDVDLGEGPMIGRAGGGGFPKGPFLAGELGTEIIDPSRNMVTDARTTKGILGRMAGGVTIVQNNYISSTDGPGVRKALREAAPVMVEQTRQIVMAQMKEDLGRESQVRRVVRGG